MFMFQFAPGSNYAIAVLSDQRAACFGCCLRLLQRYLCGVIHTGVFLYGYLCKRVALKKLLWWGNRHHRAANDSAGIHPLGECCDVAGGTHRSDGRHRRGGILRSRYAIVPPGLQGTLMMLVDGFYLLSYRVGDLLGSKIYSSSPTRGFLYCVIATTVVYALILPVILLVPKELIATADGEPNSGRRCRGTGRNCGDGSVSG